MEIHGLRFQVIPGTGIPAYNRQGVNMAKGILSVLRKALLKEGIDKETVETMISMKGGKVYFSLDAVENLLQKVAEKTKSLLDEGEPKDYETLVKSVNYFADCFSKPRVVKRLRTFPPGIRKRKVVDGLWSHLATQVCHDKRGRPQTFTLFKKREFNQNTVSNTTGLKLLAEVAERASKMDVPDLAAENPVLVRILEAPPHCST